jgi:hypothetical protein
VQPTSDTNVARRRRRLGVALGVTGGIGAAALVTGVFAWSQARTGGPLHRRIRAAAEASVADADPRNDVPPNLPEDQDYCEFARA